MYTEHYGLREKPFSLTPDPRFLFLSASHREALAHLLYGIEQGEGFIAVTGEVGTGKTTLCRTLLERLGPDAEVAYLFNPRLSGIELLEAIHARARAAGRRHARPAARPAQSLPARREPQRAPRAAARRRGAEPPGRDARGAAPALEPRDHHREAAPDRAVRSAGARRDARLARAAPAAPAHRRALAARIALAIPRPATTCATACAIAAGGDAELFTPAALRELRRRSRGVPRLVNLLATARCSRAMLTARCGSSARTWAAPPARSCAPGSAGAGECCRAGEWLAGKRSD